MSDPQPQPPPPAKRLPDTLLLSSLAPPKKPKPDDEEAEAHLQLISALLASSSPSSPTSETPSSEFKVRFVPYPYQPLSPFGCSSSYVTINGNEETCGSSFSEADSSVMASVDTCGLHITGAFGFLRDGNGDVLEAGGVRVKSREGELVVEEGDEGWDWRQFLGEDEEEGM